jgi:uncharacterized protein (TIGR03435 family)
MKLPVAVISALTVMLAQVNAQTPPSPEFDVATLKGAPVAEPGQPLAINLGTMRNGRVTLNNVTLSDCIRFAYGVASDDQVFGPEWIKAGNVRFEIVGQAPPNTTEEQLRLMVRSLLAERLKLRLHQEQKELPFLALTVAKTGSKLAPAREDNNTPKLGAGSITHNRMPMAVLAMLLSRFERQIVIDLTQLTGGFAVNLQWIPDNIRRLAPPDGGPIAINGQQIDPNGPSLYTAIQEQLGLRLESRRGLVDAIVVDSAEKVPLDN